MTLPEIYNSNDFVLSYELFPPKTDKGAVNLNEHLKKLLTYNPHFITCTYGAGGSTRDKTLDTLAQVQSLTDIPVASHLTCVQATADEIRTYLQRCLDQGVENIVAIRGDAPEGEDTFEATQGGFSYANELVDLIHTDFPQMGVAVGGYPEIHPEAVSADADLDYLKKKVDAGAHIVVTQLFYDNAPFLRFRDACVKAGITIPIVPGLLPVTNYKQVKRIASLCGAKLPSAFQHALENAQDDKEEQFKVGVEQAAHQADELIKAGIPGIHFYVLNQSRAAAAVLDALHPLH